MTASAVMAAGAGSLLGQPANVVTSPFALTAAVNTSNTTVGFADSDLYGMTPEEIDRTLDEMQAMGVNNVRVLIPWAGIELADDFYYWETMDYVVEAADSRGMGILGVLNSTPAWATEPGMPAVISPPADTAEYAEFVGIVAERYAGQVGAYEVWNEPNAYFYWAPAPDPAAYTELLQAAYPAIKAADPDATVVGGVVGWVNDVPGLAYSPANYVEGMYEAGAAGYFDALSYHPYHYTLPFSQGRPYGDIAPIRQLEIMHDLMVANGDGDKLIWTTEYGEPTSVATEAQQAAFIQDYLTTWSTYDYTGPSFIYTTRDRNTEGTTPDETLGVLRDDWTWKQAAYVIQNWTSTHPQTVPDAVTLTAMTAEMAEAATDPTLATTETAAGEPLTVAPMEATEVPATALTAPAATEEVAPVPAEETVAPTEETVDPTVTAVDPTAQPVAQTPELAAAAEEAGVTDTEAAEALTGPVQEAPPAATAEAEEAVAEGDPAEATDTTAPADTTDTTGATDTAGTSDTSGATDSSDSRSTGGTDSTGDAGGSDSGSDSSDSGDSSDAAA